MKLRRHVQPRATNRSLLAQSLNRLRRIFIRKYQGNGGLTVIVAGKHPVSFRTRQLSLPTYSSVLWCESPREGYPRKGAGTLRLGGEPCLIPSGVLRGKLHCLKSRSPWSAVKPPLQTIFDFFVFRFFLLIYKKIRMIFLSLFVLQIIK